MTGANHPAAQNERLHGSPVSSERGSEGASAHLRELTPEIRRRIDDKRLVFTVTAGRSGTSVLADVAGLLPRVASFHEPSPKFADVFRWMLATGDPDMARRWWIEVKLPRIARIRKPVYVETSHVFCKGFLDALLALGFTPALVMLRRPGRAIARSMYELGTIPGRTLRGDRWYLRPDDPGVLNLPGWQTLHDYQLCYWYTLEIERRQRAYADQIDAHHGERLDIDLSEVTTVEGFQRLSRFLIAKAPPKHALPIFQKTVEEPRNQKGGSKMQRRMPDPGDLDALEDPIRNACASGRLTT